MSTKEIEMAVRGLSKMDVPEYKRDVVKPQTVKWLLDNLRTRNHGHIMYVKTMNALIAISVANNWIKVKEARTYEQHLQDLPPVVEPKGLDVVHRAAQRPKITLRPSPTGRLVEQKPELQDLSRSIA